VLMLALPLLFVYFKLFISVVLFSVFRLLSEKAHLLCFNNYNLQLDLLVNSSSCIGTFLTSYSLQMLVYKCILVMCNFQFYLFCAQSRWSSVNTANACLNSKQLQFVVFGKLHYSLCLANDIG